MKLLESKWAVLAIVTQSLILFIAYALLFATPHMWDSTYAAILGERPLPALTQLVLNLLPVSERGTFCLAFLFSFTPCCLGLMLIATAVSGVIATQRFLFVNAVIWGMTFFLFVIIALAQAVPFLLIKGCGCHGVDCISNRASLTWTLGTALYATMLTAAAIWFSRRKKKADLP